LDGDMPKVPGHVGYYLSAPPESDAMDRLWPLKNHAVENETDTLLPKPEFPGRAESGLLGKTGIESAVPRCGLGCRSILADG